MNHFTYKNNELYCEGVPLKKIAAEVGTATYVYSYQALVDQFRAFDEAFKDMPHLICFAMKANSNLSVLKTLIDQGAGIDIVSGGELFRALKAGVDPQKIVFAGVGKTPQEMKEALEAGILQFNVESEAELEVLNSVAVSLNKKAPVSLRVNPNINPKTHPYISTGLKKSKFGVPYTAAVKLYEKASKMSGIKVRGVSCHIGSQITTLSPFRDALNKVIELVLTLRAKGIEIEDVDLGGGLGICYKNESPPTPAQYAAVLKKGIKKLGVRVAFEPGRFIVGNSGVLLTQVVYKKSQAKDYVIVDAAMNDLIRPALYGSYHEIQPVKKSSRKKVKVDIVGPVCESGDFFAEGRLLPPLESGDLLAIMSAGAYGFVMASRYNSRPLVSEILVKGDSFEVVRSRESYEDLIRGEILV